MLTADEIIKVLDELIGVTEPVADTYFDDKVKKNLEKQVEIIECLIDNTIDVARHKNAMYKSCATVGDYANTYIESLYRKLGSFLNETQI